MVTTVLAGQKLVTLPEDVRRDLGLQDGIEYVAEQSGDGVVLRPSDRAERLSYPSLDDALDESQLKVLERVDRLYGSLARHRTGPVLSREEEREMFERAVADENSRVAASSR